MGFGFVQLFSNTFFLEFCSLAFHLEPIMWLFCLWWECLFLSRYAVPLQSACVTLIFLFTLWHMPLTLCIRTEPATDTVQPCACFLSVTQPSVLGEKLSLGTSKHYTKVCSFSPPKIIFWLVDYLLVYLVRDGFCNRGT